MQICSPAVSILGLDLLVSIRKVIAVSWTHGRSEMLYYRVSTYVSALRELGIEASEAPHSGAPVCVLSEAVHCDTPTVTSALDGVVAVLATPPNSYSAVTDPIDLVCGRGGDLTMLEVIILSVILVTSLGLAGLQL